jgi:hypothetical protein
MTVPLSPTGYESNSVKRFGTGTLFLEKSMVIMAMIWSIVFP